MVGGHLAAIAGFEIDPERGVEEGVNECHVRGDGGAFVVVALAPAGVPSIREHASGYAGEANPAPDLGAEALVVDAAQPHAVFEVVGHVVDVGVENFDDPPDAATAVEAAKLARAALAAANGGDPLPGGSPPTAGGSSADREKR